MRLLTYTATAADTGKKVKHLLRGELQLSYTLMKSLKWRQHAILLNGQPCTVAAVIHSGDVLTVNITDTSTLSPHIAPVSLPLDIVWEDEDLLILNKPAGIAVHSAALTEETVTIAGAVSHYLGGNSFHPVNRLDKGVSGLMVIAKNGHAHDLCMKLLHTEKFQREYRGICEGIPSPARSTIDLPIGRDPASVVRRCIAPDGLEAHTCYEVLSTFGQRALLRLQPLTGRTHQLRLHCAAMGHPLVGDWLYGTEVPDLITRPALHSYELWLCHPLSHENIHLTAPLPEDMAQLITLPQ